MPLAARLLALAGAVLMPVSLFLDWYTMNTGDSKFTLDGWDAFETTDAIMVLSALVVVGIIVTRPRHGARALMAVGAFSTGLVAVQLIDGPALFAFLNPSEEVGAWLGLFGALLVLGAGVLSSASGPRTEPAPAGGGSPPS